MRFTFGKNQKLKQQKLWELVFSEGQTVTSFPLSLKYVSVDDADSPGFKMGVAVPKKKFRRATDRNRIKRLIKEAYRLRKPLTFNNLEGSYALVFLYLGKQLPSFEEVEKAMDSVLKGFLKKTKSYEKD